MDESFEQVWNEESARLEDRDREAAMQNEIENNDPSIAEHDCPICGALAGTPHTPMQNARNGSWGIYCDGKIHRNEALWHNYAKKRQHLGYGLVTIQLFDGRKFEYPDAILIHDDEHIRVHTGNRTVSSFHNSLVSEAHNDNAKIQNHSIL